MQTSLRACLLSSAILSLALAPTLSLAAEPAGIAAETQTPPTDKGSNFVHCDGKANTESSLSLAARLIALSLVVGLLIPEHEQDNVKLRRSGAEGIKACDAALNGQEKASDGGRRLELIIGRAIHRMEIGEWQAAIDDLHTVQADQPELTSTRAYRQSLGQTVAFLEGISLVGKGDNEAAVALGYKIANESYYDPSTLRRASVLILLSDGYSPEKQKAMDQVVRLNPSLITLRAIAHSDAGKFTEAGADYEAYGNLLATVPNTRDYAMQGLAAVGYRLGGDAKKADALMEPAKAMAETDSSEGKHTDQVTKFREISDFYAIVTAYDTGQTVRARNMLSAHTNWNSINYGYLTEMTRRLQTVGTAEEQANSPLQTPQQVMDQYRKAMVSRIISKGDKDDQYWGYFIPSNSDAAYGKLAPSIWKSKNSSYLSKTIDPDLKAQFIDTSTNGVGMPCAYGMYMHLAVMAKAQGKSGFMIMPTQKRMCAVYARIGNPDDKDMVPTFMMDADTVISDLTTYFPKPAE